MSGFMPWLDRAHHGRVLAVTATIASSLFLPGTPAAAQGSYDYDCTDFDSRRDAQAFYEEAGGPLYDPFNLDEDKDGIACEEWKRDYDRTAAGERGINGADGIDTDCADYANQQEAQRYFLGDGGSNKQNVDHLDPNHNGIACEEGEPG
jgi:excalibur calcium-binding domain-containing protein